VARSQNLAHISLSCAGCGVGIVLATCAPPFPHPGNYTGGHHSYNVTVGSTYASTCAMITRKWRQGFAFHTGYSWDRKPTGCLFLQAEYPSKKVPLLWRSPL
jgi:hypothetical protein